MTHSSVEVGGSSNVPAFLTKLWKLVEDPNYDHLIHWSQNGKSFIISNQAQFSKELLPLYFKHNNMASFIRQLNMYGFRKLTNIENSGLRAERDDIEFYHLHFVKDQEASLELIKRKIKTPLQVSAAKSIDENEVRHDDVGSILVDVKAIKGKQDTVDNILVNMQKENEALWREIAILRRKYQKQQHIVEKLLQFLLSLVHQRGIGVKRKSPLMIGLDETGDVDGGELSKSKRPAKDTDNNQTENSLDKYGPTIFDVSDDFIEAELEATANNCPIIAAADLSPLTAHTSESPIDEFLDADQIETDQDAVDALFNPIQSVIDSSMMTPNNLTNTDIDTVQALNTNSTLIDPSTSTITIDGRTMEALFNPSAIQSVLNSSLITPDPSETINSLNLVNQSNKTRRRTLPSKLSSTGKSTSTTTTTTTTTTPTSSSTLINQPLVSLESTDDNMVTLMDPLQSVIESTLIQPIMSTTTNPTLNSSSTLTATSTTPSSLTSTSSSPTTLTTTISNNSFIGNNHSDLVTNNSDLIEQSIASIENDDGNVDALLGPLQSVIGSLPLTIFDLDNISNNF